jgi:hypothetical protein
MSKVSELRKCVCGGMAIVTASVVYLYGHHEGCMVMERLCEVKGLPQDQPHGPENDHRPGNGPMRMTVQMAASSTSAMPSMAVSPDTLKGLNWLALGQRPKLIE